MQQTIRVPIRARYSVIDGVPILQEAEYADVDVKIIVEMLLIQCGIDWWKISKNIEIK